MIIQIRLIERTSTIMALTAMRKRKLSIDETISNDSKLQKIAQTLEEHMILNNTILFESQENQEKETNCAYDVIKCKNILKSMDSFYKTLKESKSDPFSSFVLVNNINSKKTIIKNTNVIQLKQLKSFFENTGHSYAIQSTASYVIPFILDLDCNICKKTPGKCLPMVQSYIEILKVHLQELLSAVLQKKVTCYVFKRENRCNLHVYFDFNVSIILYEELIQYIENMWLSDYCTKYTIDCPENLPLPYSAKEDGEVYLPKNEYNINWNFSCTPNQTDYFDLNYDIQKFNISGYIVIGKFTDTSIVKNSNFIGAEAWSTLIDTVSYLLQIPITLNGNIVHKTTINTKLLNFCKLNFNFESEKSVMLDNFLRNFNDCNTNNQCLVDNTEVFRWCENKYQKNGMAVYEKIEFLTKHLVAITYNVACGDDFFAYLVNLLFEEKQYKQYTCYIVLAFIKYVAKNTKLCEKLVQEIVCKMFLKLLSYNSSSANYEITKHIISCLLEYKQIDSLLLHVNDIEWLALVSILIKRDDNFEYYKFKITQIDSVEQLENYLVEYLKSTYFTIDYGEEYYFYNKDTGIYKTKNEKQELYDFALGDLKKLIKFVPNLQSTGVLTVAKDAWNQMLKDAPQKNNLQFNMYNTFICTNHGIFNTITGLYEPYFPYLYFKIKKAYCYFVPGDDFLNDRLLKYRPILLDFVKTFLSCQNLMYYFMVMLPGLLNLDSVILEHDEKQDIIEERSIFLDIFNVIAEDCSDFSKKNLYFTLPLVYKYNLNLNILSNLMHAIYNVVHDKQSVDLYTFTPNDVKIWFHHNKTNLTKKHDINITILNFTNLATLPNFDARLFALAVVLYVLDKEGGASFYESNFDTPEDTCNYTLDCKLSVDILKNAKDLKPFALHYIFKSDLDPVFANLILSLSGMFNYNENLIKNTLQAFAALYCPANSRKHFVLMCGPPKSGKSTIHKMIKESHENSCFNTEALFPSQNSGSSDANPLAIKSCSSYAINCIEVKTIYDSTLKIITGGDDLEKRGIMCNKYKNLNQYSFASGTCNDLPYMTMPDEAIKERMIIIPFINKIVDTVLVDNSLLLKIKNTLHLPQCSIKKMAYHFSNILYAVFLLFKNENESISAIEYKDDNCCNEIKFEIDKFMIKNNIIYKLFHDLHIVFNKSLSINMSTLKELIEPQLEIHNNNNSSKKQWDWYTMQTKINSNFKNNQSVQSSDEIVFEGFGIEVKEKNTNQSVYKFLKNKLHEKKLLIPEKLSVIKYKTLLCKLNETICAENANILGAMCKTMYASYYDIDAKQFTGLKINF